MNSGGTAQGWQSVSGGSMTWPSSAGIAVYAGSSAWGTSLTAPTGTIVGTSDTQTLTNKTLDGVSSATMGYLDATSSIQTQLNGKQASLGYTPTNAAVVPSTAPSSGQLLVGNTGGTAYAAVSLSGDCTMTYTGAITCTKSSGTAFGTAAFDAGPSGTIVGTSDTQTLTNKTLDGVSSATMGYLDATSSIQTQLNSKAASTATIGINGTTNEIVSSTVSPALGGSTTLSLATAVKTRQCEMAWGGTGTSNALQSGDDGIANNSCYNETGVTETIVGVYCRADVASNTTTVNPTFGSSGTGTSILGSALSCGSSYAYAGTTTISNASLANGDGIDPVMGGTLSGTNIHVLVVYTMP
jgi:hypothetical protein